MGCECACRQHGCDDTRHGFMHSIVPRGFLEITKMQTQRRTYATVALKVRSQSVVARARTTAGGHTTCLGMHAPTRGAAFWPEKTSSARLPDHSTTTNKRRDAFGALQFLAPKTPPCGAGRASRNFDRLCPARFNRVRYRGLPLSIPNVQALWRVSRALGARETALKPTC